MKEMVNINIVNKQKLDFEQSDVIKSNNEALFYKKNDIYYLIYNDHSEGIDGAKTTLKIDEENNRILLLRAEPAKMKQVFCKGERKKGYYQVDERRLDFEVKTNKIKVEVNDDEGKIKINYITFLMGEKTAENSLEINYSRKGVD